MEVKWERRLEKEEGGEGRFGAEQIGAQPWEKGGCKNDGFKSDQRRFGFFP